MKANELRIGNFVKVNNQKYRPELSDKILVVSGIHTNRVTDKFKSGTSISFYDYYDKYKDTSGQFLEFIEPIPLTEKWLERFGFGKCDEHEMSIATPFIDISVDWHFNRCFLYDSNHTINNFKYVHQLQNLYFSLTEEELTPNI